MVSKNCYWVLRFSETLDIHTRSTSYKQNEIIKIKNILFIYLLLNVLYLVITGPDLAIGSTSRELFVYLLLSVLYLVITGPDLAIGST